MDSKAAEANNGPPPYQQVQQNAGLTPIGEPNPAAPVAQYPPQPAQYPPQPAQYAVPPAGSYPAAAYPPQGPGQPFMQQPMQTATTVIRYGPNPQPMTCIYCHTEIVTSTVHTTGTMNWIGVGATCGAGFILPCVWLGCQFIPLCIDSLKDVQHSCPNCKKHLGLYNRAS